MNDKNYSLAINSLYSVILPCPHQTFACIIISIATFATHYFYKTTIAVKNIVLTRLFIYFCYHEHYRPTGRQSCKPCPA